MGKGFFLSKGVGVLLIICGAASVATIIALSVVYSQEKAKNNEVSPTNGGSTTNPPVTTPAPTTSNKPWDQYRLPKTLVPEHYNLMLRPRLTPDETTKLYIFTGESSVDFKCVEETDLILIHSNKLNYTKAPTLESVNPAVTAPNINKYWLQKVTQYLVIELDAKLKKDHMYRLSTDFVGELADDLGGFYRSEYEEDGGCCNNSMQPTDARKSFPCFDEPALKAVFNITLTHPQGTIALSNGAQKEKKDIDIGGEKLIQTTFAPTEKMSTYLLAYIVSDFDFVNNTIDGSAIAAGQGEYALNTTGPILKFFEDYYNSKYPLPKSDQIALPDFNAGAMENWGLITYRETALLYDPEFSSNGNKERIATIIAHELAHMWFGNLVTLRWWNDLWLNEGFASYVEYLGANYAEPDWGMADLIVLNDVHRVFAVDALTSSHPLSSKEEDIQRPEQISELFDAISYSKVTKHQHLLQLHYLAVDNTPLPGLPNTVADIMNTWVLQMGFPVVTIDTASGTVTQKHFLLDPDSEVTVVSPFKYVPMHCGLSVPKIFKEMWLVEKSGKATFVPSTGTDWVLANLNVVGYYRVNYDQSNWNKLLNALNTNHSVIPVINRAQLVDDAFNMARAKIVSTTLALSTTVYLDKERDFMPWESATDNMDFFYLMFDRSEVYGHMQAYLQKQVIPLFNYYKAETGNWTKDLPGHLDQYNLVNAISLACKTGHKECTDLAKGWFEMWMNNPAKNPIHPNLRSTVYCNAIAAGGAKEWEFAWAQFTKANAIEADKLRYAMACTKEPWLLNRYLEYTLTPEKMRKQDATSTIVYIANNVVGQALTWDFIRARWTYIFNEYGGGSFSFSNLINGVTKRFSTEFELKQLRQFKEDNADIGFGSGTLAVDQSIERTISNMKWIEENTKTVSNWFQEAIKPL
uniref:Aminopeptidase n=1 Tax=Neogobius melanostomus TaxID=47308 RepID=A0A8C6WVT6_9GOBI